MQDVGPEYAVLQFPRCPLALSGCSPVRKGLTSLHKFACPSLMAQTSPHPGPSDNAEGGYGPCQAPLRMMLVTPVFQHSPFCVSGIIEFRLQVNGQIEQ